MKFVFKVDMFIKLILLLCFMGCGHKIIGYNKSFADVIADTRTPIAPVYQSQNQDTPKIVHLSHQERVELALAPQVPIHTKDTLVRKLSDALVNQLYWSHDRTLKKDTQINRLESKIDKQGDRINQLAETINKNQKNTAVAKTTISMFGVLQDYCLGLILIFVLTHFIVYLTRKQPKPSTT